MSSSALHCLTKSSKLFPPSRLDFSPWRAGPYKTQRVGKRNEKEMTNGLPRYKSLVDLPQYFAYYGILRKGNPVSKLVGCWGSQGPKEADGPLSGSGRVTGTGIKGFMRAKAQ